MNQQEFNSLLSVINAKIKSLNDEVEKQYHLQELLMEDRAKSIAEEFHIQLGSKVRVVSKYLPSGIVGYFEGFSPFSYGSFYLNLYKLRKDGSESKLKYNCFIQLSDIQSIEVLQ